MLILGLVLSNNIAYANEANPIENDNDINTEEKNFYENSTKDIDDIKKEDLTNYIEMIRTSKDYLSSSSDNRLLYDNAIEFNSRSLETDNEKWIAFSYKNLTEDIDTIKDIEDGTSPLLDNINQNSLFYKDLDYKIAYLKLSKENQVTLDNLKREYW